MPRVTLYSFSPFSPRRLRREWRAACRYACVGIVTILLLGCSQKFNDVNDTMKLALFGEPDAVLTADEITLSPYASIYARVGDGPQAFMVLALAEPKLQLADTAANTRSTDPKESPLQLKWLSADKGMLTTEYGRLVKSLNLPQGNLVASTSNQPDPLRLGLHRANTPMVWERTVDWQPGFHFGYPLTSRFLPHGEQIVMVNDTPISTLYFTETVTVGALDMHYDNHFWIDPRNGAVVKSRQKLAPTLDYVEITVLKPFS